MSLVRDRRSILVGWRVASSLIILMTLASSVRPSSAQEPEPTPTTDAWALLDQPTAASYTVENNRWANPGGGGAPTVIRSGVGRYAVTWPGLNLPGGNAQITSTTAGIVCNVTSWAAGTVDLACFNSSGEYTDAGASVLFTHDNDDVYVYSDQPSSPSYTPLATYANNPRGSLTVDRTSPGIYTVRFPHFTPRGGHAQVTAYGVDTKCQITNWVDNTAAIRCHDFNGNLTDSRFSFLFTISTNDAYVWGLRARSSIYMPYLKYTSNPGGGTVTHFYLDRGHYLVTFNGLKAGLGNVQVTPNWYPDVSCAVTAWSNDTVEVRCVGPNGEPENTGLDVLFTTGAPITCAEEAVTVDMNVGDRPTSGDDVILGTPGDDFIRGGPGNDRVCGGGGNDTIQGGTGDDYLLGDDGNDLIDGGDGADTVFGGAGDDRILGGAGADLLDGQAGNDELTGGSGNDTLTGDVGNDQVAGGAGDDVIRGGDGNDRLTGQAGNDSLLGEAGNDDVFGNDGTDTCDGGPGVDFAAPTCETIIGVP